MEESSFRGKLAAAAAKSLQPLLQSEDHSVGSKRYLSRLEKRVESFASPRDGIRKQFLLACSTLEDEKNSRMKNTEDSWYILKEQV